MLIKLTEFGGRVPKAADPSLLPDGKSQISKNCRFDKGGFVPLLEDSFIESRTSVNTIQSLLRYHDGRFFAWNSDVDAVVAPIANDIYKRIYFTVGGQLRVTDKDIYKTGGTSYPMVSYIASPPAPTSAPVAAARPMELYLAVSDQSCFEADGTYDLIFTGGTGSGAAGTYVIVDNTIASVNLASRGVYSVVPIVSTQSGDGSIIATLGADPTLMESRGYVYTFVNGYGAEGPPSAVSNLISAYDGDSVAISGMQTSIDTAYNITKKRLYRLNQGSTSAIYQFVKELDLITASYDDSIENSDLGEELPSAEWDGPPVGIKGIIALPDGSLAGFVDNILCRSVPYYPHAWPASYQKYVDSQIKALGSFGTTIAVLTAGKPYLAVGNDPANVVMESMDLGHSCTSKRGRVQAGDVVVYPSPEGLVAIGQGIGDVLTKDIMTREEWNDNYNPSSINAYYWDGKYVGFYTKGSWKAGFMFDLKSKELSDLTFYSSAGFTEKGTGILYLVV